MRGEGGGRGERRQEARGEGGERGGRRREGREEKRGDTSRFRVT